MASTSRLRARVAAQRTWIVPAATPSFGFLFLFVFRVFVQNVHAFSYMPKQFWGITDRELLTNASATHYGVLVNLDGFLCVDGTDTWSRWKHRNTDIKSGEECEHTCLLHLGCEVW
ncbi:unnamed protein product, partial [Amoebophrya sp. A25]|eukprot:GSA25T00000166001.1